MDPCHLGAANRPVHCWLEPGSGGLTRVSHLLCRREVPEGSPRRISMPVKKSIRAKKPRRLNTSLRLSQYTRLITRHIGFRSMGLAMICIITAGMLIGSHQLSRPADDATVDTQPHNAAIEADATEGTVALAPRSSVNADAADAPAVVSPAQGPAAKLTPVTITGCLERPDETTFRPKG